jgi:hypothetical protein
MSNMTNWSPSEPSSERQKKARPSHPSAKAISNALTPCVDMTRRYLGKDGVVSLDLMARACSPSTNLPAVWLRHTQLRLLVRQGLLAEWQHGTALDDAVYRVAATIPMNGVHFDPETLVQQLRHGTAA